MSDQHYYYYKQSPYLKKVKINIPPKKSHQIASKIFLAIGTLILVWVAYPLVSFEFFHSRQLAQNQFVSPISANGNITTSDQSDSNQVDYTQAGNWFPESPTQTFPSNLNSYTLSIPKLNIDHAQVSLTNQNLSQNLVHYGGTALPGNNGNGVVFGHSILPQFYNPKNYTAIFSTLHTLENGDQILTTIDGITYQYQIIDMFEVSPKDISVLEQTYDNKYLTLITCTPPGTYLRRLIVKAKLVPYQQQEAPSSPTQTSNT